MFISVSTHIFVYHEYRDDFLSIVKNSGVNSIEIFSSIPHFPYKNERFVEQFLDRCVREGIKVASVHFPLYFHISDIEKNRWTSLCTENEELRLASVTETVESARILNLQASGILVIHTSFPRRIVTTKRAMLFRDSVNRILDKLQDGVSLAVENTTFQSTRARAIARLVESFSSDRIGICVDVGHANVIEDPAKAIKAAGTKLLDVHVSDNLGDRDDHLVPGAGSIKWRSVFSTLRDTGYCGPLTLELRDPHRGKIWDPDLFQSMIEDSISFIRNHISRETAFGGLD